MSIKELLTEATKGKLLVYFLKDALYSHFIENKTACFSPYYLKKLIEKAVKPFDGIEKKSDEEIEKILLSNIEPFYNNEELKKYWLTDQYKHDNDKDKEDHPDFKGHNYNFKEIIQMCFDDDFNKLLFKGLLGGILWRSNNNYCYFLKNIDSYIDEVDEEVIFKNSYDPKDGLDANRSGEFKTFLGKRNIITKARITESTSKEFTRNEIEGAKILYDKLHPLIKQAKNNNSEIKKAVRDVLGIDIDNLEIKDKIAPQDLTYYLILKYSYVFEQDNLIGIMLDKLNKDRFTKTDDGLWCSKEETLRSRYATYQCKNLESIIRTLRDNIQKLNT